MRQDTTMADDCFSAIKNVGGKLCAPHLHAPRRGRAAETDFCKM